jgi:ABC-type uncharacterized transport system substrate-binding protein
MIEIILLVLLFFMLVPASLGMLVFYHVFIRSKTKPTDTSNRINHFRLVWFALTREELFVKLFPWLKKDEMDNIT